MSHPNLYFIRHGETAWSLSGRHTGRTDVPLTANGEMQARQLVPLLEEIDFNKVCTSPRKRAQQTCTLAGFGNSAVIETDLEEWDYGAYEGLSTLGIYAQNPGWDIFRDGCPGGETTRQISDRADKIIGRLSELQGNIALFSHGQFGCALAARWIGLSIAEGVHFALDTASVCILGPKAGHSDVPTIKRWNVTPLARV